MTHNPTLAPGQTRLDAWNAINLERMQQQVDIPLLPVYIQQAPDTAWTGMPHRNTTLPDLSDGPHLGYAIQWFLFPTVLGVGYPFFIRRRLKKGQK
jgi:surfeit locus 1 family protein